MSARRRRIGSESEQIAIIVTDSYDKHEGKLKNYNCQYTQPVRNNITSPNFQSNFDEMASRDRTKEFATTVQNLQARQISRVINVRDTRKSRYIQSHAEFMMIARTIGKNIASTYTKLEKLTLCEYLLHYEIEFSHSAVFKLSNF